MDFDFVVIGGGSAGYAAARTAKGCGLKVAVVEGGEQVGGLCILRGCMPSKALIESANRFETLRRAKEFGLRAEGIGFEAHEILARKRRLIAEFAEYRAEQLADGRFELIRAMATFLDANTLELEWPGEAKRTIRAKTFLIATGSEAVWPEVEGLRESGAITSDTFLESEVIPKSAIVLGGGPVALEAAHYWQALGVNVTVVQRSGQLLSGSDADVAEALEAAFRKRGMTVYTGTRLKRCGAEGDHKFVEFEKDGKFIRVEGETILNGLGRRPAIRGLGLEKVRVDVERGRVKVGKTQQTSLPNLFAAGDVCGPHEIVHLAITQGEVAARNANRWLRGETDFEQMDYRLKLFATFTEPQVATVGLSEAEAKAEGLSVRAASYPFDDHGKSMVMGETEGFVKLIADEKTGELVGGAVVGPHGSDLIHEVVVAMAFHSTAAQFAMVPHYHPTLAEIWTYPAEELAESA